MPSFRQLTIVLLGVLAVVSCGRNSSKQYLENGDREFDRGRFQEAASQYEKAKEIDPHDGLAHYKLGVVYLKVKPVKLPLAVKEYRRAVELLKDNQAHQEEYKRSSIQLSDINLIGYREEGGIDDVEDYCAELLRKDANSYDGYRLRGDLNLVRWQELFATGLDLPAADKRLDAAMADYRKADSIKPGEPAIAMAMGHVLQQQKHYAEAELYYRQAIDKDKSSYLGYMGLFRLYVAERKTSAAQKLLDEAKRIMPERAEEWKRLRANL